MSLAIELTRETEVVNFFNLFFIFVVMLTGWLFGFVKFW